MFHLFRLRIPNSALELFLFSNGRKAKRFFQNQTNTKMKLRIFFSHPYFYPKVDERTGFVTRNILCFPIKDSSGEFIVSYFNVFLATCFSFFIPGN